MIFKRKTTKEGMGKAGRVLRHAIGALADPRIGSTLRPMRQTTGVFVQLLAMVFASYGMFPRSHPALTGASGTRLRFGEVLGTACHSLSLTREGVPRILLFIAVIACMISGVLAVAAFALTLFASQAHADVPVVSNACPGGGGYFTPCDSTNDIALGWINYIFNGQTMTWYTSQYGQIVPQSQIIQQALIQVLAFYSDAVLIVASIVLFYHLVMMVVETAHSGVPMGKKERQIWAPIRLVVAIGLLVPVSGGLNSGQYLVITVAEWGSNMASQAWSVFVNNLANDNFSDKAASAPYARKTVYDTVMMEACMYAYNMYAGQCGVGLSSPAPGVSGPPPANVSIPGSVPCMQSDLEYDIPGGGQEYFYDVSGSSTQNIPLQDIGACGHYIYPPTPTTNDTIAPNFNIQIANARNTAFHAMQSEARQFAQQNMQNFLPQNVGGTGNENAPLQGSFEQLVSDYQNNLQTGAASVNTSSFGSAMQQIASTSSSQGWVSAGAWLNTIARAQSEMMDVDLIVPGTQMPSLRPENSMLVGLGFMNEPFAALQRFNLKLRTVASTAGSSGNTLSQADQRVLAAAGIVQSQDDGQAHLMDKLFAFVDWVAQWDGVWQSLCPGVTGPQAVSSCIASAGNNMNASNFTLGVQFTGANPFAEIAYFGHAQLKAAYDIFDAYLAFLVAAGSAQEAGEAAGGGLKAVFEAFGGKAIGELGGGISSILTSFVGKGMGAAKEAIGTVLGIFTIIFFATGMMLAFFLPLIPFFRFMFNVLTWVVSLLEAVIAVPLVALAHLNPDGEGLPGSAKPAYFFVFNIFLRPVLMVFGLVLGIIIFFIAASYMNLLYTQAVVGTGGLAHGHLMLSRFVYSFLYVFILYLAANSAFHMIDWLPEHALQWMGATPLHFQKMGDPEQLQQPFLLISSYGGQQLMQGVGKLDGVGAFAAQQALRGNLGKDASGHLDDYAKNLHDVGHRLGASPGGDYDKAVDGAIGELKQLGSDPGKWSKDAVNGIMQKYFPARGPNHNTGAGGDGPNHNTGVSGDGRNHNTGVGGDG